VRENFIGATELNKGNTDWGGTSEPPPNENLACGGGASLDTTLNTLIREEGNLLSFVCSICLRSFTTRTGLGLHRKRSHPIEYNQEIEIARVRPRWSEEEIRLLAVEEAYAPSNTKAMNAYLSSRFEYNRSLEAIKGIRRRRDYRELVASYREHRMVRSMDSLSVCLEEEEDLQPPIREAHGEEVRMELGRSDVARDWLATNLDEIIPEMHGGIWIRAAIRCVLENRPPDQCLDQWWENMFPDLVVARTVRLARDPIPGGTLSKRKARRREYRRIQELWRKNMSKAARKILDGDADGLPHPTLQEQVTFWKPILESGSVLTEWPVRRGARAAPIMDDIWSPVSVAEVISVKLPAASAPGMDGMTARRWMTEVPPILRAAIFNIFMATGKVPARFLSSRTVLIPKSPDLLLPSNYRPISVASVVMRHFHKVLATRLSSLKILDERQRGFISADGCAENISILAALLSDARCNKKQVHVLALDVRKAFDTVSHCGIYRSLEECGMPPGMVDYLRYVYSTATLRIEVDRAFSEEIRPGRGVRQGDPLSPFLFNVIMNNILAEIPEQVGYSMDSNNLNALAFADDLVIISSSREGGQLALNRVREALEKFGMELSPTKCMAFSLVPAGKTKKMKVMTEAQFMVGEQPVSQIGLMQGMKYLGVRFTTEGPDHGSVELGPLLERVRRAPLKPQQRLTILRSHLLPRFIHTLVLGRVSCGYLRRLDRQVRAEIRRWLGLPGDIPRSFFHAPVRMGGLGVMSFGASIPRLVLDRLGRLSTSDFALARIAGASPWATRKKRWCMAALRAGRDWPTELYGTVDGFELREAGTVAASTDWISDPMVRIPPSDWLHYMKVWINALPTRVRTTRGSRRAGEDVRCRGGCGVQETAAHVIQQCFRTHGGRIMRHDAVATVLASELQRGGHTVRREHQFRTSAGVRKPDLLVSKGDKGHMVDVQVISGSRPMAEGHRRKMRYYADNRELVELASNMLQVPTKNLRVSTVTLSWRGIWAPDSAETLEGLGIGKAVLRGITTRVLKGSYMNFRRFNEITTVFHGRSRMRMSGWGPPRA